MKICGVHSTTKKIWRSVPKNDFPYKKQLCLHDLRKIEPEMNKPRTVNNRNYLLKIMMSSRCQFVHRNISAVYFLILMEISKALLQI